MDVTLDLNNGRFKPFNKPGNIPLYVHRKSNHPPNIIKNLPININKRLTELSSDLNTFNEAVPPYQDALTKSGYSYRLTYNPGQTKPKNRARTRNITWYNPPFDLGIKTNIGQEFLKIIKTCFHQTHPLTKIFNKNTFKLSYCCMANFKNIIDGQNKKILHRSNNNNCTNTQNRTCNCRANTTCPLDGNCLAEGVIYQATVETNDKIETYVGLTENQFKTRYRNHKASFNNSQKRTNTELSKYIWSLKDTNTPYNIKWSILNHTKPYSNTNKRCDLCISEKYVIIFKPELSTLNKRNEIVSACRHSSKFTLRNS